MLTPTDKIWHNGKFISWDDAKIHVLSHVVSYGSSVFEGIRCYETVAGPAISGFVTTRAALSIQLRSTAFPYPSRLKSLNEAMVELVRVNNLRSCYLRPIVLRGYGDMGVYGIKNPTEVYLACWEWGKYLGDEALARAASMSASQAGIAWRRTRCLRFQGRRKLYEISVDPHGSLMSTATSEGIALDTEWQ